MPRALIIIASIALFDIAIKLVYNLCAKSKRNKELTKSAIVPNRGSRLQKQTAITLLNQGVTNDALFYDLYLQKSNNEYVHIDMVLATIYGIFVVETRDFSGWIYGNENDKCWIQMTEYQEQHRFYSPIAKNQESIAAIKENLKHNNDIPFYSLIVFSDWSNLDNVTCDNSKVCVAKLSDLGDVIESITKLSKANYTDKQEIVEALNNGIANGNNPEIVSAYINSIHKEKDPSFIW